MYSILRSKISFRRRAVIRPSNTLFYNIADVVLIEDSAPPEVLAPALFAALLRPAEVKVEAGRVVGLRARAPHAAARRHRQEAGLARLAALVAGGVI